MPGPEVVLAEGDVGRQQRPVGRVVLLGCCGLVALAPAGILLAWWVLMALGGIGPEPPELAAFDGIRPGMPRAQVVELVGDPNREYSPANAPQDYRVDGYARPKRDITGSVLIYEGLPGKGALVWRVYYVFLDKNGQVEEVWMGAD